jgi:hypothetical protein
LHGLAKSDDKRVVHSALNRDRLIKFSQKLKESNSGAIISDYSVQDEELTNKSSRPPKTATD